MSTRIFCSTLGLILLIASTAAIAGEVYQWKDVNGVTHYSQTPPPKGIYKQRAITSAGAADAAPVTKAEVENPQCATARKNLDLLRGTAALQQDTDGDGKPDKTLSEADRANQLELATATLKATCPVASISKP